MTLRNYIWLLLMVFTANAYALAEDEEPLDPALAFKLHVFAKDARTITAEWQIEKGYYLYRDKFKFKTETAGVTLGPATFPKGKIKEDEFFGKVESYRDKVAIDIPVTRTAQAPSTIELITVAQGCADIGLCYPPQTQKTSFVMPPLDEAKIDAPLSSGKAATPSLFSKLGKTLGLAADDAFLEVDQAFVFSVDVIDGNTLRARWDIEDGYYLYQNKFKFTLVDSNGVQIGEPVFPQGTPKHDDYFGEMVVYHKGVDIPLSLKRTDLKPLNIQLLAEYQGCADKGFCYPPQSKTVSLSLPAGLEGAASKVLPSDGRNLSEQDSIAAALGNQNVLLMILTFFGFGLLLSFTPCVFPMIPILSSIIVGQGDQLTTRRAFLLSLIYVLAMAVTYTAAGVFAGLFGGNLQAAFQNPWILSAFAAVFVALSFSMFGFYDLQLPSAWQSKLTAVSNSQKGGTYVGVGIMGFLSALIVGPCVAAPLAGALIYIGQTGDAVLGGIALFALSMGMGAPLLAIGASAGKFLPKAGAWMDAVKAVFGVMLLAVAIWMLERILPAAVTMSLWAALLIISAIYMGAIEHLHAGTSGWKKLWKGSGFILLSYGILLLIGVASGNSDPLQPLRGVVGASGSGVATAQAGEIKFTRVKSVADLEREVARAASENKPVFLDFYADWCVSCKEMERYTFSDAGVRQALAKGVLLQADVTANDDLDKAMLKKFKLVGPPSLIFYDRSGNELRDYRLVGFLEPEKFQQHVERAFK